MLTILSLNPGADGSTSSTVQKGTSKSLRAKTGHRNRLISASGGKMEALSNERCLRKLATALQAVQ